MHDNMQKKESDFRRLQSKNQELSDKLRIVQEKFLQAQEKLQNDKNMRFNQKREVIEVECNHQEEINMLEVKL